MAINDRQDENSKKMAGASIKAGVFDPNKERELQHILKTIGPGNFNATQRMDQFLGLFYYGEVISLTVANGSEGVEVNTTHNLKGTPIGYIVIDSSEWDPADADFNGQLVPPLLAKGPTAWTSTTVYFVSNHSAGTLSLGSCVYKIWLWKEFTRG